MVRRVIPRACFRAHSALTGLIATRIPLAPPRTLVRRGAKPLESRAFCSAWLQGSEKGGPNSDQALGNLNQTPTPILLGSHQHIPLRLAPRFRIAAEGVANGGSICRGGTPAGCPLGSPWDGWHRSL